MLSFPHGTHLSVLLNKSSAWDWEAMGRQALADRETPEARDRSLGVTLPFLAMHTPTHPALKTLARGQDPGRLPERSWSLRPGPEQAGPLLLLVGHDKAGVQDVLLWFPCAVPEKNKRSEL